MKKLFALFLSALLIFCGCGTTENNHRGIGEEGFPYTFTDSIGNEITLRKKPENTAVLFSSYAEIWKLSGGEIKISVGDSVKRGFADGSCILVNDGAGLKIDTEALLASQPDFVIVTADFRAQNDLCELLNGMGIPCAAFKEESFRDYLTILNIFTDINGNKELFTEYGENVRQEIENIKADLPSTDKEIKYLFIRAGSGFSSTKRRTRENHFACKIMDEIGAKNIADGIGALSDSISLEEILENQPDLIVIVPQGDETASKKYVKELFSQDGWKDLNAVKDGKYYFVDKELFNYKPNRRWPESYRTLVKLVYGE